MTTFCDLKPISTLGPSKYCCTRCGYTTSIELKKAPNKYSKICPVASNGRSSPGILKKGWNLSAANLRWEAAGKPVRTDEQVTEIIEKACTRCHYFTGV